MWLNKAQVFMEVKCQSNSFPGGCSDVSLPQFPAGQKELFGEIFDIPEVSLTAVSEGDSCELLWPGKWTGLTFSDFSHITNSGDQ